MTESDAFLTSHQEGSVIFVRSLWCLRHLQCIKLMISTLKFKTAPRVALFYGPLPTHLNLLISFTAFSVSISVENLKCYCDQK